MLSSEDNPALSSPVGAQACQSSSEYAPRRLFRGFAPSLAARATAPPAQSGHSERGTPNTRRSVAPPDTLSWPCCSPPPPYRQASAGFGRNASPVTPPNLSESHSLATRSSALAKPAAVSSKAGSTGGQKVVQRHVRHHCQETPCAGRGGGGAMPLPCGARASGGAIALGGGGPMVLGSGLGSAAGRGAGLIMGPSAATTGGGCACAAAGGGAYGLTGACAQRGHGAGCAHGEGLIGSEGAGGLWHCASSSLQAVSPPFSLLQQAAFMSVMCTCHLRGAHVYLRPAQACPAQTTALHACRSKQPLEPAPRRAESTWRGSSLNSRKRLRRCSSAPAPPSAPAACAAAAAGPAGAEPCPGGGRVTGAPGGPCAGAPPGTGCCCPG